MAKGYGILQQLPIYEEFLKYSSRVCVILKIFGQRNGLC